jgi:hypothetical protein
VGAARTASPNASGEAPSRDLALTESESSAAYGCPVAGTAAGASAFAKSPPWAWTP